MFIREKNLYRPAPLHILTVGRFSAMHQTLRLGGSWTFGGQNWATANLARYMPMTIPVRFTVARFLSPNNNATGNTDVGLYDGNGNLLLSTGTTARTGAGLQYIDVTNRSFPPGNYYLAMVCSGTTSQVMGNNTNTVSLNRLGGVLQEALGSTVLPATMTPVASAAAGTPTPVWGFTQSDTL